MMECKEIQIPVPWGHIAVKAWGNENDIPVLATHGLQDNAGTYDRLIPHLPKSFYYLCIDLPSHGRSSHFPPHLPIHTLNYLMVYKMIADYFDRKKYIILGHSYGAQIGAMFTQIYPEYVTKLILLDAVYFFPLSTDNFREYLIFRHEQLMNINAKLSKKSPPTYTYEEALKRMLEGRLAGELTREAAEVILKRSLMPTPDGKYQFSSDQRLKVISNPPFDTRYAVTLLRKYPIKCPVLIIIVSESVLRYKFFSPMMNEMKKNKLCSIKTVEGCHDVHNVNPEAVSSMISNFLLSNQSKL